MLLRPRIISATGGARDVIKDPREINPGEGGYQRDSLGALEWAIMTNCPAAFHGFEMVLCGFVWCERWDTYYHLFVRRLYLGSWELTFEMV